VAENEGYCGVPYCFSDGVPQDKPLVLSPSDFDGDAEVELTEDYRTVDNPDRVGALRIRRIETGRYNLYVAWYGFFIPLPGEVVQREETLCRGTLEDCVAAENRIFNSHDTVSGA